MNRNLRDCLIVGSIASVVTFGLGGIYIARAEASPALPGVEVCTEDQPCWTPLHGNGNGTMYCAVETRNHVVVAVSDCIPIHRDLR